MLAVCGGRLWWWKLMCGTAMMFILNYGPLILEGYAWL